MNQAQRALRSIAWFPWFIILLGIVLRLAQYFSNRSLWLDESVLALNIVSRSFSQLLERLDYNQAAPIGFLLLEKLAIQAFGNNEYALRLLPLLSGIASLFLLYGVAKLCVRPGAVPIALGLFAISDPLIYYSSEVKQYSSDVAVALLIYSVAVRVQSRELTSARIAILAMVGATSVWFSHPSLFVLVGVGLSLTASCIIKRQWRRLIPVVVTCSVWILSFALSYFFSLRGLSNHKALLRFWSFSFMPFPPSSTADLQWFAHAFLGIFEDPVGLHFTSVAAFIFLLGCISLYLEKREVFLMLVSPILLALLASGLHQYPFYGRFLLFTVPSALLLIAEGVERIRKKNRVYATATATILIGLLLFHPLLIAARHLVHPRTKEEIKPVMSYIREHWQSGDGLYVYYGAEFPFRYYSSRYGLDGEDYIIGVSSRRTHENYLRDLDKLHGKTRVWVLFSHIYANEDQFFLQHLDNMGARLDSFRSVRTSVYLYDLTEGAARTSRLERSASWPDAVSPRTQVLWPGLDKSVFRAKPCKRLMCSQPLRPLEL